jgi:D-3-phosphoglycerate dehydrogenase
MASFGVQKVSLEDLLARSDVVDVMCPHTPDTEHLLNEAALRAMKKTAVLINCARGKIVDNRALYRALSEGWIASAGLDDTEEEPAKLDSWSSADNPLFSLENCIITPHVAYVSEGSLLECRRVAAENAREVLLGKPPPDLVRPRK